MSAGLAEVLVRAGLGFVWGSCSLGKGPICRMRLGGFQVDFGSVLAWLGLIRARCAAGLAVAFGLLQGCGSASFGLVWDWLWGNPKATRKQPESHG